MPEALVRAWAQGMVRDAVLALVGFGVLAVALWATGRRRRVRDLTEDHLMLAGMAIALLAIVAIALYNRSTGA